MKQVEEASACAREVVVTPHAACHAVKESATEVSSKPTTPCGAVGNKQTPGEPLKINHLDDYLDKLKQNILSAELPHDIYYAMYAMHFYGIWTCNHRMGPKRRAIYTLLVIVSVILQLSGLVGLYLVCSEILYEPDSDSVTIEASDDFEQAPDEIEGELTIGYDQHAGAIVLKLTVFLMLLFYCTSDFLTHRQAFIYVLDIEYDKTEAQKKKTKKKKEQTSTAAEKKGWAWDCLFCVVLLFQCMFGVSVMIASTVIIARSSDGLEAVMNGLALAFLLDFDNYMFVVADKLFPPIHEKILTIELYIDEKSKEKHIEEYTSGEYHFDTNLQKFMAEPFAYLFVVGVIGAVGVFAYLMSQIHGWM